MKAGICLSIGLTVLSPTGSYANPQLALAFGCFNCHGAIQRGDAPTFERLSGKLAKFKGDSVAEANFVSKYRSGEPLERVEAHERLSPETAKTLVHWLVEGGK